MQFRWLGGYSWYWDDSRSKQTGGRASDDWKTSLDGIGGAIESGIVVRGRQGGAEVTEERMAEVAEEGVGVSRGFWAPQASETQALRDLWHTAGA